MADRLNIPLSGPEWEPPGAEWKAAPEAERRAYFTRLGELALVVKRREVMRGIGADGGKLKAVKPRSRPDGAKGKPLDPHHGDSRTYRLLAMAPTAKGVTLYWRGHGRKSWAKILGYHRAGAGHLPVRDTIGISPGGQRTARKQAFLWWATRKRTEARETSAVEGVRFEVSEAGRLHRDVVVTIDVARVEADLAKDRAYHVGEGGTGAARPGSYAAARRQIAAGKPVAMPRMALDVAGEITVRDGRHRFAALRDLGAREIPVSVPKGEARAVRAKYGPGPKAKAKARAKGPVVARVARRVHASKKIQIYEE